jgi:hypothetical protein
MSNLSHPKKLQRDSSAKKYPRRLNPLIAILNNHTININHIHKIYSPEKIILLNQILELNNTFIFRRNKKNQEILIWLRFKDGLEN